MFLRTGQLHNCKRSFVRKKHKQVVFSTNQLFLCHTGGAGQAVNTRAFFLLGEQFLAHPQRGFSPPTLAPKRIIAGAKMMRESNPP